jgi:hypothetical protein
MHVTPPPRRYSTGELVGFGFAAFFGLVIMCYGIYKIVECYKRKRTLNRLQSHYQLKDPGAGLPLDLNASTFVVS